MQTSEQNPYKTSENHPRTIQQLPKPANILQKPKKHHLKNSKKPSLKSIQKHSLSCLFPIFSDQWIPWSRGTLPFPLTVLKGRSTESQGSGADSATRGSPSISEDQEESTQGEDMITGWWLGHPSEKSDFVNWDDEIPNIWENKFDVPNHQPVIIYETI